MQATYNLDKVIPVGNILGEGVLWRVSDETIWWTDIEGMALYCLEWGKNKPVRFELSQRLGSFGFVAGNDNELVVAFESGFALYNIDTGTVHWLHQPDELKLGSGRRLNDGRVGPDGAFWAGSMLEEDNVPGEKDLTGLYRLDGSGHLEFVKGGFQISNGLAWSQSGKKIFCSDSPTKTIYSAAFDANTGKCGKFKVFAKTNDGEPDGAIIDYYGNYWSALWGGHCVVCYDQHGTEITRIKMEVPQPTIPVFGGPNLNYLIITSAKLNMTESDLETYPLAGHMFMYATNFKGNASYLFKKKDALTNTEL